jgi:hypothetical protein
MSDLLIDFQDALIAGDFIRAKELLDPFGDEAPKQAWFALTSLAEEQKEMGF